MLQTLFLSTFQLIFRQRESSKFIALFKKSQLIIIVSVLMSSALGR